MARKTRTQLALTCFWQRQQTLCVVFFRQIGLLVYRSSESVQTGVVQLCLTSFKFCYLIYSCASNFLKGSIVRLERHKELNVGAFVVTFV